MTDSARITLVVPGNVATAYLDPSDNHMCDVIGLPSAEIRPRGRISAEGRPITSHM